MSTQVLGSYSFASTPDVNGNLLLVSTSTFSNNAINSVPIGNATPSTGAFTTLTATTLNGTIIGNATPSSGAFTTLTAASLNGTVIGNTSASTGQFTTVGVGTAPLAASLITLAAGSSSLAPIQLTSGPVQSAAGAGDIEYDGVAFYKTNDTTNGRMTIDGWNYFRLTGAGGGITGIADYFGTNDGIPLVTGGIYEIEWHCSYIQTGGAGTATWTIVSTNALQTLTGEYIGSPTGGIGTVGAPQTAGINVTTSTSQAFPVTGSNSNATHHYVIRVMLQANATTGGNTRLRLTASAGTATPQVNSYFKVRRWPAANTGTFVA